jgi:ubiquinone/menaquinone biosynthesis C-methylase UbiE
VGIRAKLSRMTDDLTRIREQFTRTAEVYARLMQTTQERGLVGLVKLSGAGAKDRVLDVACGPGFLSMAFAARCGEVVGFDATDAFLDLARAAAAQRGLANIHFQCGDAEHLPFAEASFEVVSCRAAFHHFPRPARVLSEMRRVLAPGGRIVVADLLGSEDPRAAKLHDEVERLCDPTHVRALPVSEFERLFEQAGLRVAANPRSTLDYDLEEWISHGAPQDAARREIVARMESWVDGDPAGLCVRREDGRLRFTHQGAAFVLGA